LPYSSAPAVNKIQLLRQFVGFLLEMRWPMATVTKKELIDRIAERTQAKRVSVKRIVQAFLDEITTELCKNKSRENCAEPKNT
jgi:hypothetical protein